MAVTVWSPGEVLTATDLNDTFASKQDNVMTTKGDLAAFGTAVARLGVGTNGAVLTADSAATLGLRWAAGQKILQIVRATDTTNRTTTSASLADASISVTITPQKSDSAVMVIYTARVFVTGSGASADIRITDNSNNAVSGGSSHGVYTASTGLTVPIVLIGYSTPATTSATTYKVRYAADAGTVNLQNANATGQLYAIEVSA